MASSHTQCEKDRSRVFCADGHHAQSPTKEAEVGAGRYELLLWLQLSYCTEIHPEPSCAHGFIEVKAACCGPGDLNAKLHACLFHSIASTGDITYSGICTTH
ncbi:hypothetical protein SAY87_010416 [Trapa incisa]|uniref:Uncharacterized protein n=1 Tax=Trapa incisa TaxID=236973 RepID=A0AAN7GU36_9MYRT|nr:hypothetical protein SAY87_010416 [Trapa incisa]